MKVLAIDSSPERNKGDTARLLNPYLEGIEEAGAEVELYYGEDLVIYPCCGNLNCTVRTPGKCMAYDDMRWLRNKIGRADALILASPLYFIGTIGPEGVTASLRPLLGRLAATPVPSAEVPYEHAVHTLRENVRLRKVVFVSSCGFWEVDDFYPTLTHIKAFCTNSYPGFEGNMPEPRGAILRGALKNGASGSDVIHAAREAGRLLILESRLSEGEVSEFSGHSPRNTSSKRNWENVILYQF